MKTQQIMLAVMALVLASCSRTINSYKDGLPQGRWNHKTSEQDFSTGRYASGKAVGKWKTVVNGKLYRKSRSRDNIEKIRLYHPNGVLKSKGTAKTDTVLKMQNGAWVKEVHWYYTGSWLEYSPDGKLLRVETYEKGEWVDDPWSGKTAKE